MGDREGVARKIHKEASPSVGEGGTKVVLDVVLALFSHSKVSGGDATRQFKSSG